MVYHEGKCRNCGNSFRLNRASTQPAPTFCSKACYRATQKPRETKRCEQCGNKFSVIGAIAERSSFCSYECYWESGRPGSNSPFKPNPESRQRRKVYVGRVDGKPKYIMRSHWVWQQHFPDDPILPGQQIHHKDGDRCNDSIENLQKLWKRDHNSIHAEQNKIGDDVNCPVCGREFHRPPSDGPITCSKSCASKLRWQRDRGIP